METIFFQKEIESSGHYQAIFTVTNGKTEAATAELRIGVQQMRDQAIFRQVLRENGHSIENDFYSEVRARWTPLTKEHASQELKEKLQRFGLI